MSLRQQVAAMCPPPPPPPPPPTPPPPSAGWPQLLSSARKVNIRSKQNKPVSYANYVLLTGPTSMSHFKCEPFSFFLVLNIQNIQIFSFCIQAFYFLFADSSPINTHQVDAIQFIYIFLIFNILLLLQSGTTFELSQSSFESFEHQIKLVHLQLSVSFIRAILC